MCLAEAFLMDAMNFTLWERSRSEGRFYATKKCDVFVWLFIQEQPLKLHIFGAPYLNNFLEYVGNAEEAPTRKRDKWIYGILLQNLWLYNVSSVQVRLIERWKGWGCRKQPTQHAHGIRNMMQWNRFGCLFLKGIVGISHALRQQFTLNVTLKHQSTAGIVHWTVLLVCLWVVTGPICVQNPN